MRSFLRRATSGAHAATHKDEDDGPSTSETKALPPLLQAYKRNPQAALWSVALPTTAIGLVRTLYGVVDAYWVSRLGTDAFAAVSGCSFAYWMVLLTLDIPAIGAQCATSQSEGAGARSGVWAATVQGTYAAVGLSIALAVAAPFAHLYVGMLGLPESSAVHARAIEYPGG